MSDKREFTQYMSFVVKINKKKLDNRQKFYAVFHLHEKKVLILLWKCGKIVPLDVR